MIFPTLTALYAGCLALLFTMLSVHVVVLRGRTGIVHGDGSHDLLNRTIRSHGNFAEYVPYILLMVGLLESAGGRSAVIHLLLGPLVLARLMHPVGMRQPIGSVKQYAWRATSVTVTWLVLSAAGTLLVLEGSARL